MKKLSWNRREFAIFTAAEEQIQTDIPPVEEAPVEYDEADDWNWIFSEYRHAA